MSSHIWRFASRYLYEFKSARVAVDKSQRAEHGGWSPPPLGMFKVNVDGATSVDGRNSSARVVIRDSCGTVIGSLLLAASISKAIFQLLKLKLLQWSVESY